MRYILDEKQMAILDTKNNTYVCLVSTKRPDLFKEQINELLYLANKSEDSQNKLAEIQAIIIENYPSGTLDLPRHGFAKTLYEITSREI